MPCNCENCGGRITGLAHIGVYVKDMDRSKDFYLNTLGMELQAEEVLGEMKLALLGVGGLIIELVAKPNAEPRANGPVDHIAIACEDIDTLVCKLIEKGVAFDTDAISESSIFGGIKNIFFKGPDGESLEFFEYVKK